MARLPKLSRTMRWMLGVLLFLLALLVILPNFISIGPLRTYMENQINSRLEDYTISIDKAYFHPLSFAIDLRGLTLLQDANPDPPVAQIGKLRAKVHWRELFSAHLVGDFLIDTPKFYINVKNINAEEKSEVSLQDKGWQDAIQAIYPLKINVFRITDGKLTYIDEGPAKPLTVSDISLVASNIRNIRSPDHVYPSAVKITGTIFEKGNFAFDGQANFLQKPHAGFKGALDIADMDLSYFKPVAGRKNIAIRSGVLAANGEMEFAPDISSFDLKTLKITGVDLDYIHLSQTSEHEKERVKMAAKKAKELSNKQSSKLRIGTLSVQGSMGYVDKTSTPNYRLYFKPINLSLKNFSNQFTEGEGTLSLTGKFMGTGETRITGTFRPETKAPDFSLNVAIENTEMPLMSDLFRAYGNFDIKEGLFSFYSELRVRGDHIDGYVKPLFKKMKVYDRREYKDKNLFHKIYVGLVGGIAKILQNPPRKEVATKTSISGPIDKPSTSTG